MSMRNLIRAGYRRFVPFIYAKRDYKLLLRHTLGDIDLRAAEIMCTQDFFAKVVQPIPIEAPFGNSVLVVAPHQDDELIGCGGALLLQLRSGRDAAVVFVQDGGDEHAEDGITREEAIRIRETEARTVAREAGLPEPRFFRHPVLSRPETQEQIAGGLRREIRERKVDTIFTPFFFDYNDDHRLTGYALADALRTLPGKYRILCYEVWGFCIPNVTVKIDSVIEEKRRLLSLYASQVAGTDYPHVVTGLNMYNAISFGANQAKFAERFFEMPADDFVTVMDLLRSKATPTGGS